MLICSSRAACTCVTVVNRQENNMAANVACYVHQNCARFTRFNLIRASNFVNTYTLGCKQFSSQSLSCTFALEKRHLRHINCQGVRECRDVGSSNLVLRRTNTIATNPGGEESKFQKFRKILYDFYLGGKRLLQDVMLTWKIRRKLRVNSWDYDVLERKELWTMFKVIVDISDARFSQQ